MPKKRLRVSLLSGSILLLTASRPTKPDTTEVTVEGSMGQLEDKELAGTKTYPGSGGCNGTPARTVKVYRYYQEKQQGGTLRAVHTTETEKTVSAEVSAYETWRTHEKVLWTNSGVELKEPEFSKRRDAGTVLRLGSTKKTAHWELGTNLYHVKNKTMILPSGMVRLGSNGPAYAYADWYGSSVIPLGSLASTGLGFEFGDRSIEGKLTYGHRGYLGLGLEGELPLGRRVRVKLGAISWSNGEVYEQWQAYSGLTLIAGRGVSNSTQQAKQAPEAAPAGTSAPPAQKKRWFDAPTHSPYLSD